MMKMSFADYIEKLALKKIDFFSFKNFKKNK